MRRGHTLLELILVLTITGLCISLTVPALGDFLDWVAADGAAGEVATALAVARQGAVGRGVLSRLRIAPESLVVDLRNEGGWVPWRRFPGPAASGVGLEVSNPEVVFSPLGFAWGASNTTVVLTRGGREARVTTSRVGRVKRW